MVKKAFCGRLWFFSKVNSLEFRRPMSPINKSGTQKRPPKTSQRGKQPKVKCMDPEVTHPCQSTVLIIKWSKKMLLQIWALKWWSFFTTKEKKMLITLLESAQLAKKRHLAAIIQMFDIWVLVFHPIFSWKLSLGVKMGFRSKCDKCLFCICEKWRMNPRRQRS